MRIFTKKLLVLTAPVVLATSALAIPAASNKTDLSNFMYRNESNGVFSNTRAKMIEKANVILSRNQNDARFRRNATSDDSQTATPALSLGPAHVCGDLDAPGGEIWFYTGELGYDSIPPHDNVWFTDVILRDYQFTIYDANLNKVGTIKDKMDYRDGETRVPMCELAPIISKNFFNTDDKYELMVGLAVNAEMGVNNYRTVIYSLNGEKDSEGYDEPVQIIETLVGDVIEGASTDGKENFFLSFAEDSYPDYDDSIFEDDGSGNGNPAFWDVLCKAKMEVTVYGKAIDNNGPRKIYTKDIPLMQLPGDQQYTPFMMSFTRNNDTYMVFSYYKEPFYNAYYSPSDENVTMRDNNILVVELYKVGQNDLTLHHSTEVPVTKDEGDEILASYYSVGNMRYREDINFTDYGADEEHPALIITKDNYVAGSDDSYISSYYVYSASGERLKTIFEGAESNITISDIDGFEPQQMFVTTENGYYVFNFINLISCTQAVKLNYMFNIDDEDEALTANIDRTPFGDSYAYACEMRIPVVDDDENDNLRVLWLTKEGKFDHIDEVNMGSNVYYAQSFINCDALRPESFYSDSHHEYMVLIKRGLADGGTQEELLIAQAKNDDAPDGLELLLIQPDQRGILNNIVPSFEGVTSKLMVSFYDQTNTKYSVDFYNLPLDRQSAGFNDIEAGIANDAITFDGSSLYAADANITLYNISGAKVGEGFETLSVTGLESGLYIAKANGSAVKIVIR